jgi:enoyl-CoA hydratase/carnithine racemase
MTDVLQEHRGPALWARLNRPDALNGLTPGVITGLRSAMATAADNDDVRALVITGEGRAFCAGADLKVLREGDPSQAAFVAFLRVVGAAFDELEAFPKPVIGAVGGVAVAGGLELLLCCDLVVSDSRAKFGDAHANYGLLPGAGASVRLVRRIGLARAKHLMFTGGMVSAEEMRAAGLVNEVVADGELTAAVERLVETLAAKSPLGLRRMKQLANDALETPTAVALRAELLASELHRGSHDMAEGLEAFGERRTPVFSGR